MNEINDPPSSNTLPDVLEQNDTNKVKPFISAEQSFELLEGIKEAYYALDGEWRFIYVNRKAAQTWGRKREDLLGKSIWEEFPHGVGTRTYLEMHRAYEEQQTIRFETFSSLGYWVEIEVYPTGKGLSVHFHDITNVKLASELLEESEKRYRQIVEFAHEGIWIIDNESKTTFVNPKMAEMLGYSAYEMIGQTLLEFMDEQGRLEATRNIERRQQGIEEQHDFRFKRKDGTDLWTLVSTTPLQDAQGHYLGALAMVVDISERKQAEEGLALLAAIVASSGDGIFSITLDGIITSWNQSAETIFEFTAEEAIQQSVMILVQSEDKEGVSNFFQGIVQTISMGKSAPSYDRVRVKKDGTQIDISVTVSPLRNAEGTVIGASVIAKDITERKREELLLRQSEATLKLAQKVARIGNWTWHVQSDRLEWSDEMYRIFGIDKADFKGDLNSVVNQAIHPDDRAAVEMQNASVVRDKNSAPLEYRVVHSDGTVLTVLAETGEMILDAEGKSAILTGIVKDITERKKTEDSLKHYIQRMEIFHQIDVGLIQGDSIQALVEVTLKHLKQLIPCQRIELIIEDETTHEAIVFAVVQDSDTLLGQGIRVSIPTNIFEGYDERHIQLFDDIRIFEETRPRAKQMVKEGLLSGLSILLMDRERPIGAVGLYANTTNFFNADHQEIASEIANQLTVAIRQLLLNEELERYTTDLEQKVIERTIQLQTVNQELDSFAYVVSHDLKAPLRGVTQLANWLNADYAAHLDDEGRKMLSLMVGRSTRMHQMIEDILQYSRIGRISESPTGVDLNRLVADVIDLLLPPSSIQITVAADLPIVYIDGIRIRQVFQNLIGNAIKYMDKPDGKIDVRWEDKQDYWQFAVADNGPGIATQYYEKIFQIFQTLAPRDDVEGTGIGLALVKKIVGLYGGKVWLDSSIGQGTTFFFMLPKTPERKSDEK